MGGLRKAKSYLQLNQIREIGAWRGGGSRRVDAGVRRRRTKGVRLPQQQLNLLDLNQLYIYHCAACSSNLLPHTTQWGPRDFSCLRSTAASSCWAPRPDTLFGPRRHSVVSHRCTPFCPVPLRARLSVRRCSIQTDRLLPQRLSSLQAPTHVRR